MKFALHRTKKDCIIPNSALAVAGFKKEKELRLEVDNGVAVILRTEMDAKKLLSVSEFLRGLAMDMVVAVALECGGCVCCGDEECEVCESLEHCSGINIPDCLLEQAGIADCGIKADVENGSVVIRALGLTTMTTSSPMKSPKWRASPFLKTTSASHICGGCCVAMMQSHFESGGKPHDEKIYSHPSVCSPIVRHRPCCGGFAGRRKRDGYGYHRLAG